MAVAFDASASSIQVGFLAGPTTRTWSHTCTGSNIILFMCADLWQDTAGVGTVTSASYNSVAMTKVNAGTSTSIRAEIWYLVAPATGANTVSVTVTGATDAIKLCSASFTGVIQSASAIDNHVINATTTGAPSKAIVTVADNCGVIDTVSRFSNTDLVKGASQTQIYNDSVTSTLGAASYLTTPKTPAGSVTMSWTGNAAQDCEQVVVSFAPVVAATGPPHAFMTMGVGR